MALDWQQFGLKRNPFDTLPLVEGGDLPIEKAFVGRMDERDMIDSLFEQETHLCLIVAGEVGVGKTSLVNFQKFIWKYNKSKLLFSSRREIEASKYLLDKRNFLLEIIGSVLRELQLLNLNLLKDPLLQKIKTVVEVSQSIAISGGASAFGFGLDASHSKEFTAPVELTVSTLEGYLRDLVGFIKETRIGEYKYSGLIVHVNNFDVVLKSDEGGVREFFDEIRDILQTPDVFFIFIGPSNFYEKVLVPLQRVRGIFYHLPLIIKPMSKTDLRTALDDRMELLKSENVSVYVKPFEEKLVFELYDLYEGDVRSILNALVSILHEYSDRLAKPLTVKEGLLLLCRELWRTIEKNASPTDEQKQILRFIANQKNPVSNKEIADALGKQESNMSAYYLKPLKDAGIIELKEQVGTRKLWGISQRYSILSRFSELQDGAVTDSSKDVAQLRLI